MPSREQQQSLLLGYLASHSSSTFAGGAGCLLPPRTHVAVAGAQCSLCRRLLDGSVLRGTQLVGHGHDCIWAACNTGACLVAWFVERCCGRRPVAVLQAACKVGAGCVYSCAWAALQRQPHMDDRVHACVALQHTSMLHSSHRK